MAQIIDYFKEKFQDEPNLSEIFEHLKEIRVQMAGNELFEDAYVADFQFVITENGEEKIVDDENNSIYGKVAYKEMGTDYIDWQMFEMNYPEQAEAAEKAQNAFYKLINTKTREKLLDHYIDHVHDYTLGEIKDFVIKV